MSVNPGFAGQAFLPEVVAQDSRTAAAVRRARPRSLDRSRRRTEWRQCMAGGHGGANAMVAGSAVFGSPDFAHAIASLR
jgi:ribulose-phosphate 3-epimerase